MRCPRRLLGIAQAVTAALRGRSAAGTALFTASLALSEALPGFCLWRAGRYEQEAACPEEERHRGVERLTRGGEDPWA